MSKIYFSLEKRADERTGVEVDTLIKHCDNQEEVWCTVTDLDQLFDTCVRRWGSNWDLEKVKAAITESGIE